MPHDVLISHSSLDKPLADAMCNRLESQGIRCWIAPRDVPVGKEYADSIVQAIESSKVVVLVYSKNADDSDMVRREIERAVSESIPIMPVRIEDTAMSKAFEYYVGSIHWLDAITPPLEEHIDKLAQSLKALLAEGSDGGGDDTGTGGASGAGEPVPPKKASVPTGAPSARREKADPPASGDGQPRPGRRNKAVFGGVGAVLVAIAAAVMFYMSSDIVIQSVQGSPEATARASLENQGFQVRIAVEESSDFAGGEAIRTDPGPGESARRGGTVTLVVSGMVLLPRVTGSSLEDAMATLTQLNAGSTHLSEDLVEVEYVYEGETAGVVLGTSPEAGEAVLVSDPLTLRVAADQVSVPAVTGMTREDAVAAVSTAHLAPVVTLEWVRDTPLGTVLGTDPEADARLERNSEVRVIAQGAGGWIYVEGNRRSVGESFNLTSDRNRRTDPNGNASRAGAALSRGTPVMVLGEQQGGDWLRVVVIEGF